MVINMEGMGAKRKTYQLLLPDQQESSFPIHCLRGYAVHGSVGCECEWIPIVDQTETASGDRNGSAGAQVQSGQSASA